MIAVHCFDLPRFKYKHGYTGIHDFSGDLRKVHEETGLSYVARITIWKDPVTAMQRTKAHNLLYKNLRKDSTGSWPNIPDYVLLFRKHEGGERGAEGVEPVPHTRESFPIDQWQKWASPVWLTNQTTAGTHALASHVMMDVDQGRTLNVRASREEGDERHMCPLQLDLIERLMVMYSNEGDVVFSPFAGVGSEGVVALDMKRRFAGVELKPSYFTTAGRNLEESDKDAQTSMF